MLARRDEYMHIDGVGIWVLVHHCKRCKNWILASWVLRLRRGRWGLCGVGGATRCVRAPSPMVGPPYPPPPHWPQRSWVPIVEYLWELSVSIVDRAHQVVYASSQPFNPVITARGTNGYIGKFIGARHHLHLAPPPPQSHRAHWSVRSNWIFVARCPRPATPASPQ